MKQLYESEQPYHVRLIHVSIPQGIKLEEEATPTAPPTSALWEKQVLLLHHAKDDVTTEIAMTLGFLQTSFFTTTLCNT